MKFFTYGTLRPGMHNAHVWKAVKARAEHDGHVILPDYKLVTPHQGFPYAVSAPGERTIGCLIAPIDDKTERWLTEDLDALEGHPFHYERIVVSVLSPDGPQQAHTYVASADTIKWWYGGEQDVFDNDWKKHAAITRVDTAKFMKGGK